MDILKDRQTRGYSYISRYAGFPFYYNTKDNKYIYGITGYMDNNISYVTVPVTQETTLANLANMYYGRPDYWWVIADFNHIQDPFVELSNKFDTIKLPTLTAITYEKE